MLKILKNGLSFLVKPFRENLDYLLFLFLISSSFRIINLLLNSDLESCLLSVAWGLIQCYLICLPLSFFNTKIKLFYKVIFLILGSLSFVADMMMFSINSVDFFLFSGIILATNLVETLEFLSTLVSWKDVLLCIVFIGLLILSWVIISKVSSNRKLIIVTFVMVVVSIPAVSIVHSCELKSNFLGKYYTLYTEYSKNNCDLKDYYSDPKLKIKGKLPQNIVIVIGESFSKRFSSLYGYSKCTNPRLGSLSDSTLLVYDNVTSAFTSTEAALKTVLSTFSTRDEQTDWYKKTTLFEIFKSLGYKTFWISNQFEKGIFENITSKYAGLCDSTMFVGAKISANIAAKYDEVVLAPFKQIFEEKSPKVIFVHLYGSHFAFDARYPNTRQVYHASDYPDCLDSQKETRAHYDNSIIYNDSIVYQIFDYTRDKETLGFYFSDHGLDVFETKSDYAAHALLSDPESVRLGKQIPFMIYLSSAYRNNYPEQFDKMLKSRQKPFVTEDFMYSLMDILGVNFVDNDNVRKYSVFSN